MCLVEGKLVLTGSWSVDAWDWDWEAWEVEGIVLETEIVTGMGNFPDLLDSSWT